MALENLGREFELDQPESNGVVSRAHVGLFGNELLEKAGELLRLPWLRSRGVQRRITHLVEDFLDLYAQLSGPVRNFTNVFFGSGRQG